MDHDDLETIIKALLRIADSLERIADSVEIRLPARFKDPRFIPLREAAIIPEERFETADLDVPASRSE